MEQNNTRLDKRIRILEAALAAYAQYGIHEATTRQIADLAGIGKSTIFEYFKSSTELMDAAFALLIARSAAGRARLLEAAETNPAAALSAYFDGMTSLILHEPEKLLLISQYVTAILASGKNFDNVKERYAELLQPSAASLVQDFRSIVDAGIHSGAFRPEGGADTMDCVFLLSAITREMQSQAFIQSEDEIKNTCRRLKQLAMRYLGVNKNQDTE